MTGIAGKVALITGTASGIGKAGAQYFAQQGATVVCVDLVAEANAETVNGIKAAGGTATAVTADVRKSAQVQAMVEAALKAYGRIDILWNNAGVFQNPSYVYVEETDEEDWDRVLDTNLKGCFLCTKYIVPVMKKQGKGSILMTASLSGLTGHYPGLVAYHASKGGLVVMTKMLAVELAPFNIRVNAIAPAMVNTRAAGAGPQSRPPTVPRPPWTYPYGEANDTTRKAEPVEVARMMAYLASDEAGPLTGSIVTLDGGMSAR